ncbi:hypothetical protein NQ317_014520 [Molorchus minor]|uniref:N-acetylglucosamine-6-phosphate deacetylase n=1 Tax=Molorchus minor TaxID=1323400 RepID=A0ABQ9JCU0_9CUCU|nr:hypothetical protein NQ317_014520 [Molorchus minor]
MTPKLSQFVNCRILRNHKFIKEDIWVRDGKIVNPEKIFFDEKIQADIVIDCKGLAIAPGFIELQINGGYGYDFRFVTEQRKSWSYFLLPNFSYFSTRCVSHSFTKNKTKKWRYKWCHNTRCTCRRAFYQPRKEGAHPAECILDYEKGISAIENLYGSLENIKLITLAPEFNNSAQVIRSLTEKGIVVSLGHSTANLSQGEAAVNNGATFITHLFNAMLPFHHRDPGLVGLLASDNIPKNKSVYFGIIADNIHTHPAALRIAYRVHPNGLVLVTDAVSAHGLTEGTHKIGQMNVEIRDKKAYVAGTNTLCGSIATMIECVQLFVKSTGCTPEYALEAASLHPAQALGIEKTKGTLNFGADC